MLKLYRYGNRVYQFAEGKQPAGAEEVKEFQPAEAEATTEKAAPRPPRNKKKAVADK